MIPCAVSAIKVVIAFYAEKVWFMPQIRELCLRTMEKFKKCIPRFEDKTSLKERLAITFVTGLSGF